jgi:hypothetical protein
VVRRAGLAFAGLIVAFCGVEAAVRILVPQNLGASAPLLRGDLTVPGDHPVVTGEYRVTVHVNAEGFADREWGPKAKPRVVVIGDSFVQAAQVPLEAGFGRQLQDRLGDVEVLSMGVPGAGTATELGVLERYALAKEPDLVILGFLVANDVMNNHPLLEGKDDKPFYTLRDGKLVPSDAATMVMPSGWLWEHSHAFRWIARTWAVREATRRKIELGGGIPIDLRVHDPHAGPVWEEAWTVTDALVAEMAAQCAAHHVKFATVLFPDQVQSTPDGRAAAVSAWPAAKDWDFSRAEARAASVAGAHGPVLDLLPAFTEAGAAGGAGLYFPKDGHWTEKGHALAAETTAPFVRELLAR